MGDIKKNVEEVATEVVKSEEPKKLSYEELENIAHQLSEQARSLYSRVQQLENNAILQRLNFLFMVIDKSRIFAFPDEFVKKCTEEIIDILTLPEDTDKEISKDEE